SRNIQDLTSAREQLAAIRGDLRNRTVGPNYGLAGHAQDPHERNELAVDLGQTEAALHMVHATEELLDQAQQLPQQENTTDFFQNPHARVSRTASSIESFAKTVTSALETLSNALVA
ncbi:MAG: hypothetical protein OXU45_03370, partial [Candidatus Melainabacteria bacterium]|nr:hypothetical protein [Candidatus Melainabacteria bacterium]